jgi:hypothetical protein
MRGSAFLLLIVIGVVTAGGFFYFRDTQGPVLQMLPASGPVSAKRPLTLTATDAGGLKNLLVTARQGEKSVELHRQTFADGVETLSRNSSWKGKRSRTDRWNCTSRRPTAPSTGLAKAIPRNRCSPSPMMPGRRSFRR